VANFGGRLHGIERTLYLAISRVFQKEPMGKALIRTLQPCQRNEPQKERGDSHPTQPRLKIKRTNPLARDDASLAKQFV
jgi:hypothetical protein